MLSHRAQTCTATSPAPRRSSRYSRTSTAACESSWTRHVQRGRRAVNPPESGAHSDSTGQAPSRWRQELKKEWKKITDRKVSADRPRYSKEEYRALLEHADQADPRLRLCLALGAEYRLGQVVRAERSDLNLSQDRGIGHGAFRIHGTPRKPGGLVYLTPEMRATVDEALGPEGHLSAFEERYQEGDPDDYPLFPGGRLRQGKCVVREDRTRQRRSILLDLFYDLEEALGIDHVDGRG